MLPAVNRGAGKNIGFPDVCMTPAGVAVVPIPYPNQAPHAMAVGFSPNVFLAGKSALNVASIIPITAGDEAGTASLIKQMGKFTKGSAKVMVNNLPGIHLTCQTTGNNMNNGLGAVLKSGVSTVFYTYALRGDVAGTDASVGERGSGRCASAPGGDSMAPDEVDCLAEEMAAAGREAGAPLSWSIEDGGVGFVRIFVFSPDVPARLFVALELLVGAGVSAVVIDVRGNPGGSFSAFVEAASMFLPRGSLVATFIDVEGDRAEHRSFVEQPCLLPLVIVVDPGTASAAELFAECLSSHGRATVVGGPTYGKKTAQRVLPAPGGGAARVAAGRVEVGSPEDREGEARAPGATFMLPAGV